MPAYAEARTSARRLAANGRDADAQKKYAEALAVFLGCPVGAQFRDVSAVATALMNDPAIVIADDALRAAGLSRE